MIPRVNVIILSWKRNQKQSFEIHLQCRRTQEWDMCRFFFMILHVSEVTRWLLLSYIITRTKNLLIIQLCASNSDERKKNRMNKKQKRIRFHRANEVILWYDVRNGFWCKLTSVLSVFWDKFASIRLFFVRWCWVMKKSWSLLRCVKWKPFCVTCRRATYLYSLRYIAQVPNNPPCGAS